MFDALSNLVGVVREIFCLKDDTLDNTCIHVSEARRNYIPVKLLPCLYQAGRFYFLGHS